MSTIDDSLCVALNAARMAASLLSTERTRDAYHDCIRALCGALYAATVPWRETVKEPEGELKPRILNRAMVSSTKCSLTVIEVLLHLVGDMRKRGAFESERRKDDA